jgi:hypothetical protein
MRIERGRAFAQHNARMIRALQRSGQASADLDPMITAHALSGVVSRMATWFSCRSSGSPSRSW